MLDRTLPYTPRLVFRCMQHCPAGCLTSVGTRKRVMTGLKVVRGAQRELAFCPSRQGTQGTSHTVGACLPEKEKGSFGGICKEFEH